MVIVAVKSHQSSECNGNTPKTMKSLPNSPFFSQTPWWVAIVAGHVGVESPMKKRPKTFKSIQKLPIEGTALKTGVSLPIHEAAWVVHQGRGSPLKDETRFGENGVSASKTPIFLKYICIDFSPNPDQDATARIDFATHLPQQHEPGRAQGIHRRDRARGAHCHSWTQAPSRRKPEPCRGAARVGGRGRKDHGPSREHTLRQDLPTRHPTLQKGQARLFPCL
jgi:hypothetical protein